jgi:hypothetical protein
MALAFYNAEIAMILAVFFAMDAAQKHADCRLPELQGQREDTWSSLYRFLERGDRNTALNHGNYGKTLKIVCNWSSCQRATRLFHVEQISWVRQPRVGSLCASIRIALTPKIMRF